MFSICGGRNSPSCAIASISHSSLYMGELVAKVTDIVGLHLDPPENAIVLFVDEKS